MTGRIASLNGTTFPVLELQGRMCQRESGCVGHAAGSQGRLGHYLTWFVPGVAEFFHFTWDLERKQGPCIWGIITFFFYSKANAPYFPGVGRGVGFRLISALRPKYFQETYVSLIISLLYKYFFDTKFSCFTSPPTQQLSFFKNSILPSF